MDTAAVLGNAMADGLLAVGANRALTVCAPERVAQWLDAHGDRIGRVPANIDAADHCEGDLVDLNCADRQRSCCRGGAERCSILRQVHAAGGTRVDVRRVA